WIQLHVAATGQEWKALRDLLLDLLAAAPENGAESPVELEFLMVLPKEIQNRAYGFAIVLAESAAQLLQEHCRAIGGPEHDHGVDRRDVDSLVEQVHGEDCLQATALQILKSGASGVLRRVSSDRSR